MQATRRHVMIASGRSPSPHAAKRSALRRIIGVAGLALLLGGCGARTYSITGTWHIAEIPNNTWTFASDGTFLVVADNAPYDTGSYQLTSMPIRRDLTTETAPALQIRMATEKTPPYAITWLDANRFYLTADHVALTLYR